MKVSIEYPCTSKLGLIRTSDRTKEKCTTEADKESNIYILGTFPCPPLNLALGFSRCGVQ